MSANAGTNQPGNRTEFITRIQYDPALLYKMRVDL